MCSPVQPGGFQVCTARHKAANTLHGRFGSLCRSGFARCFFSNRSSFAKVKVKSVVKPIKQTCRFFFFFPYLSGFFGRHLGPELCDVVPSFGSRHLTDPRDGIAFGHRWSCIVSARRLLDTHVVASFLRETFSGPCRRQQLCIKPSPSH